MRKRSAASFFIQVDGGVGAGNAAALVRAGADVLVAGNAVFKAEDPRKAIRELLDAMDG
jgi:ribulose-phosphate 3-epimerase